MSTPISNLLANAPSTVVNATPRAAAAPRTQPTTKVVGDTVQLTEAEQVYQLYNQGQRVSQIASTLRLSVAAVNSYLYLSKPGV